MKLLLITGSKSLDELQQISQTINRDMGLDIECIVDSVDKAVSAFITRNDVVELCSSLELNNIDMILLPGFVPWDAATIQQKVGVPIYKGTRFASGLMDLIPVIDDVVLSTTKAADDLLTSRNQDKITEYVSKLTERYKIGEYGDVSENFLEFENSDQELTFVGTEFPPLLFAEIVNAPKLSEDEVLAKVEYYISSGADVIDIGTIYGEENTDFIANIIPLIKKNFDVFLSIDSINISEIEIAVKKGVDFVLSIDLSNIDEFLELSKRINIPKNIGLVLIPLVGEKHSQLTCSDEKVDCLFQLAIKLSKNGFENLFYDPLLKTPVSPGIISSLQDYIFLKERVDQIPGMKYPLFMGFNNVFELMDADSTGINALLAMMAVELGVCGILSTEYSAKSLGAISETKDAIKLAYWAKINKSPPINLGLHVFRCKTKNKSYHRDENPDIKIDINNVDAIDTKKLSTDIRNSLEAPDKFIHDKMGYFKIFANHEDKTIELIFYPLKDAKKKLNINAPILITGKDPEIIYKKLSQIGLVTEITHAFYLGKELARAEFAILTNSAYQEDTDL